MALLVLNLDAILPKKENRPPEGVINSQWATLICGIPAIRLLDMDLVFVVGNRLEGFDYLPLKEHSGDRYPPLGIFIPLAEDNERCVTIGSVTSDKSVCYCIIHALVVPVIILHRCLSL